MCLNLGFGLLTIPGTPLSISESFGDCAAQYESASNPSGMRPLADGTGASFGPQGEIDEVKYPTKSTGSTDPPTIDPTMFNSISEAVDASYKTIETLKNYVTGGHVLNVIQNINLHCDNQPVLSTVAECDEAWDDTPYTEVTYVYSSGASITYPCENPTFGDAIHEPIWLYFRGAVEAIIGFFLLMTLFYFVTGRLPSGMA